MNKDNTIRLTKQLKVSRQPQGSGYVPGFKLAGQYIETLGFKEGDFVDMVAENDLIIIKKHTDSGRTLADMVDSNPVLLTLIRAFSLCHDEGV